MSRALWKTQNDLAEKICAGAQGGLPSIFQSAPAAESQGSRGAEEARGGLAIR